MTDVTVLDDNELEDLRLAVIHEQQKRQFLADAPREANELAQRYSTAVGREDGQEWVQPTGAHDAYPLPSTVTHNGKLWDNLVFANVHEPGVSGWREITDPGANPPEWVQPTGAHDAYSWGDRVTFEGRIYRSVHPGEHSNSWSPSEYPPAWEDEGPAA